MKKVKRPIALNVVSSAPDNVRNSVPTKQFDATKTDSANCSTACLPKIVVDPQVASSKLVRNAVSSIAADLKTKGRKAVVKNVVPSVPTSAAAAAASDRQVDEQLASLSLCQDDPRPQLSVKYMYGGALQRSEFYFRIGNGAAIALPGWDVQKCELQQRRFYIITPLFFIDTDNNPVTLLQCTCDESTNQRCRLDAWDRRLPVSTETVLIEQQSYCIHRSILGVIGVQLPDGANDDVEEIEPLYDDPLLWSIKKISGTYGIVTRSIGGYLSCLTCVKKK